MKNLDAKKIAIIVAILIVVALVVVLVLKNGNKQTEATAEETTKLEEITNNYITEMKLGYATEYLGKEKLYSNDKTTVKDLTDGDILNTAFRYIENENKDAMIIDEGLQISLKANGYEIANYETIIKGEEVRKAIKTLFGIDWEDKGYANDSENESYFTFTYDKSLDVYFQAFNENYRNVNFNAIKSVLTKTIEATKNKKEAKITIAVAFANHITEETLVYSDINNKDKVYSTTEQTKEIKEDQIDQFTKYTITYKIDGDNYIFESIEKQ